MLPVLASSSSKCFAFRAELNGKYLQSVYGNRAAGSRIEASAGTVVANARTRFLVEPSERQKGHMHVRCCYNNRYWVPVQVEDSGSSHWIIGTAAEPEEDLSSPSCTLFQALPVKDKDKSIRFFHSGVRKSACVVSIVGDIPYLRLKGVAEDQEAKSGIFTVVGVPRQKELPTHVAFKGNDGKYLGTKHVLGKGLRTCVNFLKVVPVVPAILRISNVKADHVLEGLGILCQQFETPDMGHESVIFTTYTNDDGSVRIASKEGGFWKRNSDDWILTENVEDKNDRDALFEVVTGDGFVAIRNLGNNKFCKRINGYGKSDCLRANEGSISQYARFKLEEPVISQEISDVRFHLDEARIYNNGLITVGSDARTNDTPQVQTGTFTFMKKTDVVSKWETTVSSKTVVGIKLSETIGQAPFVIGEEVTLSSESASSHLDGVSRNDTEERIVTQNVIISPGETIKANFVASRASCDVPFSYKQTNVLTTGEVIVKVHNDGIYTGVNKYDFHITMTRS